MPLHKEEMFENISFIRCGVISENFTRVADVFPVCLVHSFRNKLLPNDFLSTYKMAEASDYDHVFKILLIGDSGVGKSSMLLRFTDDEFEEDRPCTIGVDFKTKLIDFHTNKRINLTIWDTGTYLITSNRQHAHATATAMHGSTHINHYLLTHGALTVLF